MQIALISDIHGNLEALQAVLNDIEGLQVDEIHCLGDVIGYGCDPVACLELVEKTCTTKLIGNHEYVILGLLPQEQLNSIARSSLSWTLEQLTEREKNMLSDFEMSRTIGDVELVHASPFEPDQWQYIISHDSAETALGHTASRICFFGHTHLPMIFSTRQDGSVRQQSGHDFLPDPDSRYLVNVGSVGQPRDNDPRACYTIYDTENREITYHRVDYDIEQAQTKMSQARASSMLIERLAVGR